MMSAQRDNACITLFLCLLSNFNWTALQNPLRHSKDFPPNNKNTTLFSPVITLNKKRFRAYVKKKFFSLSNAAKIIVKFNFEGWCFGDALKWLCM